MLGAVSISCSRAEGIVAIVASTVEAQLFHMTQVVLLQSGYKVKLPIWSVWRQLPLQTEPSSYRSVGIHVERKADFERDIPV